MKMKVKTKKALEARTWFSGAAAVARRVGCSREHLSKVLHGRRKANDELRRKLFRLGVTKTAEGEEI